ncbi:MAG: hypothetical protein M3N41_13325 [Acidobacteriota bacterium]|nr:hypothetical protein [Acidobacteriota bacterium]
MNTIRAGAMPAGAFACFFSRIFFREFAVEMISAPLSYIFPFPLLWSA